jgi:hypothetical protein
MQKRNPARRSNDGGASGTGVPGRTLTDPKSNRTSDGFQGVAVYSGQRCAGHLISRGKAGVEAFDREDRSLGVFADVISAANAVTAASPDADAARARK